MGPRITMLTGAMLCLLLLAACAKWTPPEMPNSPDPHPHAAAGYSHPIAANFDGADVIARVRLVAVEEHIHTFTAQEHAKWNFYFRAIEPTGDTVYAPAFHFKFEVLEYFRGGNGADHIWGYSLLRRADSNSKREASRAFAYFRENRDKRWDDREAIVFLRNDTGHTRISLDTPAEHYYLGWMHGIRESYSVNQWGGWFPSTSSDDASGTAGETTFLIRDPDKAGSSESSSSSATEPVGLSKIRRYSTMTQLEIDRDATAPGWAAYRARLGDIDLTAEQTDAGVTLQWEKKPRIFSSLVEYKILRKTDGAESFTRVTTIPPKPRDESTESLLQYEYTDTTELTAGTTYTYAIRASVDFDDDYYDVDLIAESVEIVTASTP